MWNFTTYKAPSEKFRDHKNHIERLLETKSTIKFNKPKKPLFLFNDKRKLEIEKYLKINYENDWIMKKIIEHETNHRPYHPSKIKHIECPPFLKETYSNLRISRENEIKKENNKLYKRLKSAKTLYPLKVINEDFENHKIYERLRISNKQFHNPNLFFEKPSKVRIKIVKSHNLPILQNKILYK